MTHDTFNSDLSPINDLSSMSSVATILRLRTYADEHRCFCDENQKILPLNVASLVVEKLSKKPKRLAKQHEEAPLKLPYRNLGFTHKSSIEWSSRMVHTINTMVCLKQFG